MFDLTELVVRQGDVDALRAAQSAEATSQQMTAAARILSRLGVWTMIDYGLFIYSPIEKQRQILAAPELADMITKIAALKSAAAWGSNPIGKGVEWGGQQAAGVASSVAAWTFQALAIVAAIVVVVVLVGVSIFAFSRGSAK